MPLLGILAFLQAVIRRSLALFAKFSLQTARYALESPANFRYKFAACPCEILSASLILNRFGREAF
jgi:hypothetical protein